MASQLREQDPTQTADRRQWGRFMADVGSVLIHVDAGDVRSADVLDESFGGIGLLMDDVSRLTVGMALELTYDGTPMKGTVRNVSACPDGRHRVGVEWPAMSSVRAEHGSGAARIEGRLFVLIHMWHAGRADELVRTATSLKEEAHELGHERLAECADALLVALNDRPADKVLAELTALVNACVTAGV